MDLFALASTIQADKERKIVEATRRRRYLAELAGAVGMMAAIRGAITGHADDPAPRPTGQGRVGRSAATGSTTR